MISPTLSIGILVVLVSRMFEVHYRRWCWMPIIQVFSTAGRSGKETNFFWSGPAMISKG